MRGESRSIVEPPDFGKCSSLQTKLDLRVGRCCFTTWEAEYSIDERNLQQRRASAMVLSSMSTQNL